LIFEPSLLVTGNSDEVFESVLLVPDANDSKEVLVFAESSSTSSSGLDEFISATRSFDTNADVWVLFTSFIVDDVSMAGSYSAKNS
jgi:hypothetical protein